MLLNPPDLTNCFVDPVGRRGESDLVFKTNINGKEQVVVRWVSNPYWQYFCGYDYFQFKVPYNASSLTSWCHRLGQEGLNKILAMTIELDSVVLSYFFIFR